MWSTSKQIRLLRAHLALSVPLVLWGPWDRLDRLEVAEVVLQVPGGLRVLLVLLGQQELEGRSGRLALRAHPVLSVRPDP